MADLTQSATQTIIGHQLLTHPANIEGTPVAVATWLSLGIVIKIANIEATANAVGPEVIVQGSQEISGDDAWSILAQFTGSTTVAEVEALTATEPATETVLACASTTNFTVLDTIYIADASVVADGEWHIVMAVSTNASVTIDYGLANQKDSADSMYTEADIFNIYINTEVWKRVNVLVIHQSATGSNMHVEALAIGTTDIE